MSNVHLYSPKSKHLVQNGKVITDKLLDDQKIEIVAVGASTGGPQALRNFLSGLPADFPIPIVVAQHMPKAFVRGLARWIGQETPLAVRVVKMAKRFVQVW